MVQPAEEMRKANGIGPLRVDGTIALAEISQELIARSNAHTSSVANPKRGNNPSVSLWAL